MTPKAFTADALSAIEAQQGALFDAIVGAYIETNPDGAKGAASLVPIPDLLKSFADPPTVSRLYAFYSCRLPRNVSVDGKPIPILEPKSALETKESAVRSFNLVFGGKHGFIDLLNEYGELGHDTVHLDHLAVRWLGGDWSCGLFDECKKVPGFDRQLAACTVSEDGSWGSDEDMLHMAGYKQARAQYAREGGNPKDMDDMVLAQLRGDDARYRQLRRKIESQGRKGCMIVVIMAITFAAAMTSWLAKLRT
jgi:hypothetical protein